MNTIQNLFQQAQLAEAAYANFFDTAGNLQTDRVSVLTALEKNNFSETQAAAFVAQWRVVDQYTAPSGLFGLTDGTGFSATLFQNTTTGQYTFSLRGTQVGIADLSADIGDIVDDGIALDQIVDMYNYWQSLTHSGSYEAVQLNTLMTETAALQAAYLASPAAGMAYEDTLRAEGLIVDYPTRTVRSVQCIDSTELSDPRLRYGSGILANTAAVDVAGHSLGGHLAMAFSRLFPSVTNSVVAVNGAGFNFSNSNVNALFSALSGAIAFDASKITNVVGSAGLNFVSQDWLFLQQPAGRNEIYTESYLPDTTFGHASSQMTDSLAVYNLFATIDSSLNNDPSALSTIKKILEAASNVAANTLESVVSDLSKLFFMPAVTFTSNEFDNDRDLLYSSIDTINSKLNTLPAAGGLQLVSLVGKSAAELKVKAEGLVEPDNAIAYRYALVNLNPFAIVDHTDTLYTPHNQHGELDLYDPNATTNPGALTEQYLTDRAAMLAAVIQANTNDAGAVIVNSGDSFTYQDVERNLTLDVLNTANYGGILPPLRYKVIFGGNNGDTLTGTNGNDRIYDGSGNDTLNGGAGGDYLEGGRGDDAYVGLNEHDTVLDVQGNDSYQLTGNADATITDVDGIGDIAWDGTPVTGGSLQSGDTNADGAVWQSADGVFTYTRSGADLLISKSGDAGYATLKHFNFIDAASGLGSNDTLGISFSGAAARSGHALTSDSDTYDTAPGETAVLGLDGNDIITVTTPYVPGASVFGGDGNDSLYVEDAQDYSAALLQGGTAALPDPTARGVDLFGEGGNDFIEGSLKADTLNGGDGVNWLSGLFGDDTLIGGPRTDLLHGNADTDFLFSSDQLYREAA